MICKACGAEMPDHAKFCRSCGTPVESPGESQAESPADRVEDEPTIKVVSGAIPVPPPTTPPTPPPPVPPAAAPVAVPPPAPPPPGFTPTPPPPSSAATGTPAFPPPPGGYNPQGPPPKKSHTGLWIGIGLAAAIVIAAAIAVPLLLLDKDDDESAGTGTSRSTTTTASGTTTTTASGTTSSLSSTTTSASSTTTSTSTTTTVPAVLPGDSEGQWVEMIIDEVPEGTYALSLSDQALLLEANDGMDFGLYAYMLDSGTLVQLPIEGSIPPTADLDGLLAVWQEGRYNEETGWFQDQMIYAYRLPDGEKVPIVNPLGETYAYPQVALPWVTWAEAEPWETDPEEYWAERIFAAEVDSQGLPTGTMDEVVSGAPAFMWGDSGWYYSLSSTHLAYENHAPHHLIDEGSYVFEIGGEMDPVRLGGNSYRPSVAGHYAVFWDGTLRYLDLETMSEEVIDPDGDFATAGPTYAAYFRSIQAGDFWTYELVARGYSGEHEQVLAETETDAYFLGPVATSESHLAFVIDGVVRLFEWEAW